AFIFVARESPMSIRFRCSHCRVPLSAGVPRARMHLRCPRCGRSTTIPGAPRPPVSADDAPEDADRLESPRPGTRWRAVAQVVAGLLAGVAGIVVCVWGVEGGALNHKSKQEAAIVQAGDSPAQILQEKQSDPPADPPPEDQPTPPSTSQETSQR